MQVCVLCFFVFPPLKLSTPATSPEKPDVITDTHTHTAIIFAWITGQLETKEHCKASVTQKIGEFSYWKESFVQTLHGNNLGYCRNSWTVQQKERSEKEKTWTWRIWEILGSEQHQCMKNAKQNWIGEKCRETEKSWGRTTARENWIGEQCSETEQKLRKNNSKRKLDRRTV